MRQNTGTLLFSDSPSPNSFFPLDTAYRPWGPPSLIFLLMEQDTGGTQNLHSLLPANILRSSSSLKERQRPSREEGASCSWSRLVAKAHPPIVMLFPFQLPLWCWPQGQADKHSPGPVPTGAGSAAADSAFWRPCLHSLMSSE